MGCWRNSKINCLTSCKRISEKKIRKASRPLGDFECIDLHWKLFFLTLYFYWRSFYCHFFWVSFRNHFLYCLRYFLWNVTLKIILKFLKKLFQFFLTNFFSDFTRYSAMRVFFDLTNSYVTNKNISENKSPRILRIVFFFFF